MSSDAARLLNALHAHRRRTRWQLEDLTFTYVEALPHMRGRPEVRRELGQLIEELTAAGLMRASTKSDITRMPPLPAFVDVIRLAPRTDTKRGSAHGWRPELAQVLDLRPGVTATELKSLERVNRWLAEHGNSALVCGSRERSLEVFGDEKQLDEHFRYSRLFTSGILSYELLRCRRIAPGLAVEIVGHSPVVLVVENADTFRSVTDVLAQTPDSPVGLVAWGAGAAFEQSCDALLTMQVDGVGLRGGYYFGDVDPSGLRIPARAADLIAPLALLPAEPLYVLLFDRDIRGPAREKFTNDAAEHAGWLGGSLSARARAVMADGSRLAQEAVTTEIIRARLPGSDLV